MLKTKKLLIAPSLLMVLHLLYTSVGVIIPPGSIFSAGIIGLYMLIGLILMFKTISKYNNPFLVSIAIFLLMEFAYFIFAEKTYITLFSKNIYGSSKIISIFISILPLYIFYYYSAASRIPKKLFVVFTICFIILMIPKFYYEQEQRILSAFMNRGLVIEDTTINTGYAFLEAALFLPLIVKYKKLSVGIMALLGFYILLSAKRGAILLYGVYLLMYLPIFLKKSRKSSILLLFLLGGVVIIGANYFSQDTYLMGRYEATMEGNLSKRDDLYGSIWNAFWGPNLTVVRLIFGYGFLASKEMSFNVAHNDWLELLAGQGILGVVIYLNVFVQFWKRSRSIFDKEFKVASILLMIVWFGKSCISMGFSDMYFLYVLIGYFMGSTYKCRNVSNDYEKNLKISQNFL